jgi:hypothetical protein
LSGRGERRINMTKYEIVSKPDKAGEWVSVVYRKRMFGRKAIARHSHLLAAIEHVKKMQSKKGGMKQCQ